MTDLEAHRTMTPRSGTPPPETVSAAAPGSLRRESAPRRPAALHDARSRLEHARSTRLTQLRALAETGHSADDHLVNLQRTAIEGVLKSIDDAFARVEDSTYGTCRDCAGPIPVERLEILPYTPYCVTCQRTAR